MKKILNLLFIVLTTFVLIACGKTNKIPKNLTINADILSYDEVVNAEHYNVYVDQNKFENTNNTFNLITLNLEVGSYKITVTAVFGNKESKHSESVTYEVKALTETAGLTDNDKLLLLKIFSRSYELNLSIEDFDNEISYYGYLRAIKVIESFDLAASKAGVTNDEKMDLFNHMYLDIFEIKDFNSALEFIDKAIDIKLNKEITASLVYEFLITSYEMNYRMKQESNYQQLQLSYDRVQYLLNLPEYTTYYDKIDESLYSELRQYYRMPFKYNELYPNSVIDNIINGTNLIDKEAFVSSIQDETLIDDYTKIYDQAVNYVTKEGILQVNYYKQDIDNWVFIYNSIEIALNNTPPLLEDETYNNLIDNELEFKKSYEDFYVFIQKLRPIASNEIIELFVAFEFNEFFLNQLFKQKDQIILEVLKVLPSAESFESFIYSIEVFAHGATNSSSSFVPTISKFSPLIHEVLKVVIETIDEIPKEFLTEINDLIASLKAKEIAHDEIVNIVIEKITEYLIAEVIGKMENMEMLTKENVQDIYNIFIDIIIDYAMSNNFPNKIIINFIALKDLFEPLYSLYNEVGNHLPELITRIEFNIKYYKELQLLEGIEREAYLTLYSELNENTTELLKILLPILNNDENVNDLFDVLAWLLEPNGIPANDIIFNIINSEREQAILLFKLTINFMANAHSTTSEINWDSDIKDFTHLDEYQLHRIMFLRLNIYLNKNSDVSENMLNDIKGILFERLIAEQYFDLDETALNKIKADIDQYIIDFKNEVGQIYEFNFSNLTDLEKLTIDNFLNKYLK